MDIQRKAYEKLLQWKNSSERSKAILIKGARRVGKSYLAEAFAKKEYQSYILIDFASPLKGTKAIFERYGNRQNLTEFFNQLSVLYSVPLYLFLKPDCHRNTHNNYAPAPPARWKAGHPRI